MFSVSYATRKLERCITKTIGIGLKPDEIRAHTLAAELAVWLKQQGMQTILSEPVAGMDDVPCMALEDMPRHVNLMVVLGGDGTLLHVARRFVGSDVPLLGINLGRIGFLTAAPVDEMLATVSSILEGGGQVVSHISLKATSWRGDLCLNTGFAINDVVLQRNEHPRMIAFEMHVAGQFVFSLRADGLVLATPAGSTAYALSAGGPIVHPSLAAISVVPICPHTLSNRPVVVPDNETIEIRLTESPAPAALNLDGQEHLELCAEDRVIVEKEGIVSFVYLPDRNYYQMLRSKLNWAERTA